MPSVFAHQVITDAGLALAAAATSSNPIVWAMGLSNATVPSDPEDKSAYTGIMGTVDAASSTQNVARIVVGFSNDTNETVAVKAVALLGKLANQDASQAVIAAYVYDADSSIELAPSEMQRTRFAFNLVFNGVSTVSVFQTGDLTVADAERFVSIHRAGDAASGDDQTVLGVKTFKDMIIAPDDGDSLQIGSHTMDVDDRGTPVYVPTANTMDCNGILNVIGELRVEGHVASSDMPNQGSLSALYIRNVRNLRAESVATAYGYGNLNFYGFFVAGNQGATIGTNMRPWPHIYASGLHVDAISAAQNDGFIYVNDTVICPEIEIPCPDDPRAETNTTLTCDLAGSLIVKGSLSSSNSGAYLGSFNDPWSEIYASTNIYLTGGLNLAGQYMSIHMNGGCVELTSTFDSSSGLADTGRFRFSLGNGEADATVEAGKFEGVNTNISQISSHHTPGQQNIATIAPGALIMAFVPYQLLENPDITYIPAGRLFPVTQKTYQYDPHDPTKQDGWKHSTLRYPWKVAALSYDQTTGSAMWCTNNGDGGEILLSKGSYRILCSVYVEHTTSALFMAVLLQKISDDYEDAE